MNTRRHNTTKRRAPGASFLLATALLLLVLSNGAHAAAPLGAAQSDAVFWLLREMQDEARVVSVASLQNIAPSEESSFDQNEVSRASTRDIEVAAQRLSASRKTKPSTFHFAPPTVRDLSPEIATRVVSASHQNALHPFANHLTATSFPTFANAPRFAPRLFVSPSLREYSGQLHSAAFRSGVRSNAFPQ